MPSSSFCKNQANQLMQFFTWPKLLYIFLKMIKGYWWKCQVVHHNSIEKLKYILLPSIYTFIKKIYDYFFRHDIWFLERVKNSLLKTRADQHVHTSQTFQAILLSQCYSFFQGQKSDLSKMNIMPGLEGEFFKSLPSYELKRSLRWQRLFLPVLCPCCTICECFGEYFFEFSLDGVFIYLCVTVSKSILYIFPAIINQFSLQNIPILILFFKANSEIL